MATLGDTTLSEIVARLVVAVAPEKIILFGSRATGAARQDSDYDLLLVKAELDPSRRRTGKLYQLLWGIPNPVDLLWFTPDEVEQWAEAPQRVAAPAVRRGVVVYEK